MAKNCKDILTRQLRLVMKYVWGCPKSVHIIGSGMPSACETAKLVAGERMHSGDGDNGNNE